MFTVCPKCTLTLAVTANDLRLGQGYVRCGRCSNVFNALLKLSDAPSDGAIGAELPELSQADPASTSQIHRAITAAAADTTSTASGSAAPAPKPAPRPPAAPTRPMTSPAPSAPVPTSTPASASLPKPATIASPATPAAASPAPSPAPSAAATSAVSSVAPGTAAPLAAAQGAAPARASAMSAPPPAARSSATTASAGAAAALTRPAPSAKPAPSLLPAPSRAPPFPEADSEAIDQFELVLQTLGLNTDGDEPLRLSDGPEPTHMVESIVLEGDEVTQSQSRVPDTPLDELDLFTRRLGLASNSPTPAPLAVSPAPSSEATAGAATPAAMLAARRARSAGVPAQRTEAGGAATAAARAAGRDVGAPTSDDLNVLEPAPLDLDIPGLRPAPPGQRNLWLGGTIALVVLLFGQLVDHWREALAASPTWGRPVTGLYAALGTPLQPHWDLSAYEVRQQGAESDSEPHGAIRVRFSLANHALRPQPMPLLRLTLLDRYGRRVAQSDLAPADYWPQGRSPQSFLSADERVDTEVQVRDPSADSASFELDVCLRDALAVIRCASDAAAGAPSNTQ